MDILDQFHGFEWDKGNQDKNFLKHQVTKEECEETFFDPHKRLLRKLELEIEERYLLIGMTRSQRLLFVVFTLRRGKARVISARDLNKRERALYEERA